jgi:two-component sensor histidine kinase
MSATGDLARAMREKDSGTLASRTLDGVAVFSAFQRCAHGWTAVVSVPEAILRAPVDALIRFLALMIALVLAATVLGAYAYGRVLGDELAVLADNARRMGEHEKLRPFNWRIAEVATAQQAFAEAAEKAEHLLRELDHRVKNTLSVVQSIASRTVRNAGERAALYGRIGALNRAHDALSANRWSDVPMIPLLRSICDAEGVKVDMAGPDLSLKPRTATGLAQVWQELCANAKLHGALSCPEGRVVVHWTVQDKRVEFEWREPGHPAPSHYAPSFGLKVVELCIVRQLNGALRVDADPAGWTVRFGFPLQSALGVAGAVSSTA